MARILLFSLLLALTAGGCVSKSKMRTQQQKAFRAGQAQAAAEAQAQSQSPSISVLGYVKNPVIPWSEDLTLAKTIAAAEYQGLTTPGMIYVVRNGHRFPVKPRVLLSGQDFAVEAGDIVEIVP